MMSKANLSRKTDLCVRQLWFQFLKLIGILLDLVRSRLIRQIAALQLIVFTNF